MVVLHPRLASKPDGAIRSALVETTATAPRCRQAKNGDAANRWLARNRSLVLRQPLWVQSLAALMIGLGIASSAVFFSASMK